MTLSFMIRKKYLKEKVQEQIATSTFHERRAYKPFWRSRIRSVGTWGPRKGNGKSSAVFLCGRYAYYADILNIRLEETPSDIPGIGDVVLGKLCYNIECKFFSEELEGLSIFLEDKAYKKDDSTT